MVHRPQIILIDTEHISTENIPFVDCQLLIFLLNFIRPIKKIEDDRCVLFIQPTRKCYGIVFTAPLCDKIVI